MRFVLHALDRPDSLALRLETRPRHLEYMAGFDTLVAGPMLDPDGKPCGSCIIVEVADQAAAEAFAAGDPYQLAGLFESVSLHPFHTVTWPVGS
ncbi:MAG: hypothetical protein RLZZ623_592 [Actinomycetota bacterium]|jgi:uncharacterized protein YciI